MTQRPKSEFFRSAVAIWWPYIRILMIFNIYLVLKRNLGGFLTEWILKK